VAEDASVDAQLRARRTALPEREDADAGHEHRQRREHERCAKDGAHADLVRPGARREHDRDDRDERLGEGRADGRKDGPHGALGEIHGPAEPLDPVGEELRAREDDHERDEQDEQVHGSGVSSSRRVRGCRSVR
jgi:hypothetical protein